MIFDSLFATRSSPAENPLHSPYAELESYIRSGSGVSVSENAALNLAAVYSCIYILSSSLAQLPLGVLRKSGKNINQATDHQHSI